VITLDDVRTLLDYHYWSRDRLGTLDPLTAELLTCDMGRERSELRR
jgi:hypothetical protein